MSGSFPAAQNGNPSTVTSTAATGGAQLLAANPLRQGFSISNNSTAILYLLLSNRQPVSNSVFTVPMAASSSGNLSYYEGPFGYQGEVWGIWASANGSAAVVEYT